MDRFEPPKDFSARARVQDLDEYRKLYARSVDDPEGFWRDQATNLEWFHPPDSITDHEPGEPIWFSGGRLNVSYNCVDRHAAKTPDKTAFIWAKNEPGEYEHISFAELKRRVGRMGNLLRSMVVKRGGRRVIAWAIVVLS